MIRQRLGRRVEHARGANEGPLARGKMDERRRHRPDLDGRHGRPVARCGGGDVRQSEDGGGEGQATRR